jgi:endonuclease III
MSRPTIIFSELLDMLHEQYGSPPPPPSADPLELIIWENTAYLGSDERRAQAFATLQQNIGTSPEQILVAQRTALVEVGKAGILPEVTAERLLAIAKIAYEEFGSDLRSVVCKALPEAKKALKRFPGIGDAGAERILLLTRSYPLMALDPNGLRVGCRVGFAEDRKNYSATCRAIQDAIGEQLPEDYDWLIRAHLLLRQHGQELCKRSRPRCAECPLRDSCNYESERLIGSTGIRF